jgi:hypothetical protein
VPAELLRTAMDYHAVARIRCGWLVPEGDIDFFTITKHHRGDVETPAGASG